MFVRYLSLILISLSTTLTEVCCNFLTLKHNTGIVLMFRSQWLICRCTCTYCLVIFHSLLLCVTCEASLRLTELCTIWTMSEQMPTNRLWKYVCCSSLSIITGQWAVEWKMTFYFLTGVRLLSLLQCPEWLCGPHTLQWVRVDYFLRVEIAMVCTWPPTFI